MNGGIRNLSVDYQGNGARASRRLIGMRRADRRTNAPRSQRGFTIVEVLVVLTISAALLLSAILLIAGRQNATFFAQSARNIQTELQQVMNDVGSGFYPNSGSITCTRSVTGVNLTTATREQGTNKDCVFLGKALQFGVGGIDQPEYNVYTMVGLRGDSASPVVDLNSARPRLIARAASEAASGIPESFETKKLQYGLSVSRMYYNANPSNAIGAVGFTSSLGSLDNEDRAQQVNVVAVTGTSLGASKPNGVTQINAGLSSGVINPPGGVQICLNSGTTDQSAMITIGGSDRQSSVDLKIHDQKDCL